MQTFIEKRVALHRDLFRRKEQNNQLRRQLSHVQSLANIGIISCMIAHEINNLLTPLGSYAQLALNNPDDHELLTKVLKKTVRSTEYAAKLQDSMLAITNNEKQIKQICNLKSLVDETKRRLEAQGQTKENIEKQEGKIKENLKTEAEKQLKLRFIFEEIARIEDVKVEREDIDAHYQKMAAGSQASLEQVRKYYEATEDRKESLLSQIATEKILKIIKENAKA